MVSRTVNVIGPCVYELLKTEMGTHRFQASKKVIQIQLLHNSLYSNMYYWMNQHRIQSYI